MHPLTIKIIESMIKKVDSITKKMTKVLNKVYLQPIIKIEARP